MKIIDLIRKRGPFYSLEFFPPKEREVWPAFFATVEKLKALNPLFASVTYGAGGGTQDYTLEIAATLLEKGLTPMAHLTCVGATGDSISAWLGKLKAAGVNNVLALRGDAPKGGEVRWEECPFTYASDLVRFIREQGHLDMGVGVAAYPTPHPESCSFAEDRKMAAFKLSQGSDFAVTQLFFDYREYFEYVDSMAALGVDKPIIPGVLPVPGFATLKRVLALSGCNIPAKLYLALEEADKKGPEAVKEAGIAFAVTQIRRLLDGGAPGVHLYTLNQAETCLRIAEGVGKL